MKTFHKTLLISGMVASASPVFASATGFTLDNTNFVVTISFLLFVGVLLYLKVPKMMGKLLDDRADAIRTEIDDARALQEEAKTILASYERKRKEVSEQSESIIAAAKEEALLAAKVAKQDLKATIARRLQSATDQIDSARVAAVREVKDKAVSIAIAAAGDVISSKMAAKDGNALIDAAIKDVGAKLH
ncbi:MAG: ATP F0F1 synthase subunit B [Rhodobacteraceae bacterium]|nr:ATP F0F1 synthase subunit B [Paracoccaceae bacterium]